jgi:hypothetical protein
VPAPGARPSDLLLAQALLRSHRPRAGAALATRRPTGFRAALERATVGPRGVPERVDTRVRPIRRVSQSDQAEYDSPAQARVWGGSTCSVAALTAVLRSRGSRVRIAEVLRVARGGVTPELGLVSRPALVGAATQLGLAAADDVVGYESLRRAAGAGQPVLVDVTNGRFPEGHWMVITAADSAGVRVVDSSGYNLTFILRDEFIADWSGRGIRVSDMAGQRRS